MVRRNLRIQRAVRPPASRRGFVLVTVIAIMAMSMALFGLWAKAAVVEHRRLETQQLRMQAVRLAEAGLQRAMALRGNNPQYSSETWLIPAEELDHLHNGEVRIHVTPAAGGNTLQIEATAQFPAGADRRAQSTKRIEIPNPNPGTEP
jgi:type II secretory pathway component PulK